MPIGGKPELFEHEEFLKKLEKCSGGIGTFEAVEKLNCPAQRVSQVTSTAEGLLQAWLQRSESEKEALQKIPPEAFYIRPPHITISKKKPI